MLISVRHSSYSALNEWFRLVLISSERKGLSLVFYNLKIYFHNSFFNEINT